MHSNSLWLYGACMPKGLRRITGREKSLKEQLHGHFDVGCLSCYEFSTEKAKNCTNEKKSNNKYVYGAFQAKSTRLKPGLKPSVFYVPEVLNVHVNESKKKSTFFRKIFFKQWKINFWIRQCDYFSFLNFKFCLYEHSELQVYRFFCHSSILWMATKKWFTRIFRFFWKFLWQQCSKKFRNWFRHIHKFILRSTTKTKKKQLLFSRFCWNGKIPCVKIFIQRFFPKFFSKLLLSFFSKFTFVCYIALLFWI